MPKESAVLCLEIEEHLFFIRRSMKVPTHKGQIAFLGGHWLNEEVDSLTAIKREFEEETHLSAKYLDFTQELPQSFTKGRKRIHPWHAKSQLSIKDFSHKVKPNMEWEQYYLVAINDLRRRELWQTAEFHKGGKIQELLFLPFLPGHYLSNRPSLNTPVLWGATARIVWNFINIYDKQTLNK